MRLVEINGEVGIFVTEAEMLQLGDGNDPGCVTIYCPFCKNMNIKKIADKVEEDDEKRVVTTYLRCDCGKTAVSTEVWKK